MPSTKRLSLRISLRHVLIFALLIVAVTAIKVGFQQSNNASDPLTLNRGLVGEPESLDLHGYTSDQAGQVLRDTGEGLVSYSIGGEVEPGVASAWYVSSDGKIYTFEIRSDAIWSNGDPIVAADFVLTFQSLVNPHTAAKNAHSAAPIRNARKIINGELPSQSLGVRAVGTNVLEIELEVPTPYFLQLLTHPSMYPKSSRSFEKINSTTSPQIFNGPYTLKERIVGSQITLEKNQKYWDAENVYFSRVIYHIVDEASEYSRFRAKELDVTATVASANYSLAQTEFPQELIVSPKLGTYYYGYNLSNQKLKDNWNLRAALSLAIDRKSLVQDVTRRGEKPAYGWVPPGVGNYNSQVYRDFEMPKDQRERLAKELFIKSGYSDSDDFSVEIRYNTSDVQQRIALAIQAMWRNVLGIDATLVSEEFGVLLDNIQSAQVTEVFRLSWTGDFDDAENFLQLFETGNSNNLTRFSNHEFDKLMNLADAELDQERRSKILEAAEALILEEHAVIPLYFYVSKHLVSQRIIGWKNNVLDIHPSKYLSAAM